jgi:predicted transcriptional regulator
MKSLPYFKRQIIVDQLIEELAEEGCKRPTEIKALKNYGSKQDKYNLLKELVTEGILEKKPRSHKNVEYCIDGNASILVKEIKRTQEIHLDLVREISSLKLNKNEALSYRIATFLYQLESLLQAVSATAYYPLTTVSQRIYKPKTRPIVLDLIQKMIERINDTVEALTRNNAEATGQALKLVSQLLHENALKAERMVTKNKV